MKKLSILLLLVVFTCQVAHADVEELFTGMGNKLVRGVVNTFTGWVEFPAQIVKGWDRGFMGNENNKVVGAVVGIFTGVAHSAGRTLSGLGEIAGFWAADPASNEGVGIPLDAEYAWQDGEAYDITDPNLTEGLIYPIGKKFLRGVGNSLLGFVELPGQIVKGVKAPAIDLGIVKGLWYWGSRQVDGAYDVATCLLPNPKDTKALAFDEEWPWQALTEDL